MKLFLSTILLASMLFSSCITSNLGARLDSVGKAVPTMVRQDAKDACVYKLGDDYYLECEIRYSRYAPLLFDFYGDPASWPHRVRYEELECTDGVPASARYLIRMNEKNPTLVRAADFDYAHAVKLKSEEAGKYARKGIPLKLIRDWHFLSADLLDTRYGAKELAVLPECRTLGNKLRTPLVAVISWGVDVPLSWAGSIVTSAVLLPTTFIYVMLGGDFY